MANNVIAHMQRIAEIVSLPQGGDTGDIKYINHWKQKGFNAPPELQAVLNPHKAREAAALEAAGMEDVAFITLDKPAASDPEDSNKEQEKE